MSALPEHLEATAKTHFGIFFAGHPYWRDMVTNAEYRESELTAIYRGRAPHYASIPWEPISDEGFREHLRGMRFNVPQTAVDILDLPKEALEAAL